MSQEILTTRINTHRVTAKVTTKSPSRAERLKGLTNKPITVHFGSFGIHAKTIRTFAPLHNNEPQAEEKKQQNSQANRTAKTYAEAAKATRPPIKTPRKTGYITTPPWNGPFPWPPYKQTKGEKYPTPTPIATSPPSRPTLDLVQQ
ncbi:hypothetical protein ElyMa_007004100 [Elysia marginata]|uniref:Uncharacterized protein n=1 Tax=Elysia marginata TaxID=1093978 RepID=A0AAV4JR67_9GAST|nr:hypothetical protein ElyMa_007004100 [Elysia marginata]